MQKTSINLLYSNRNLVLRHYRYKHSFKVFLPLKAVLTVTFLFLSSSLWLQWLHHWSYLSFSPSKFI